MLKSYTELSKIDDFRMRFEYLKLGGVVGQSTFGFDRHMNQAFYVSREWRRIRSDVIVRDLGCDLGIDGYAIHKGLYIHHMNPIVADDIVHGNEDILNPEYLITCTHRTHSAIHYGDAGLLQQPLVDRRPGDTKLW